jgi:hypothetical protein
MVVLNAWRLHFALCFPLERIAHASVWPLQGDKKPALKCDPAKTKEESGCKYTAALLSKFY